jgi:hypothetical protein
MLSMSEIVYVFGFLVYTVENYKGKSSVSIIDLHYKNKIFNVDLFKNYTFINITPGQKLKKNAHYIFYLHIFISWKKKGGAVH